MNRRQQNARARRLMASLPPSTRAARLRLAGYLVDVAADDTYPDWGAPGDARAALELAEQLYREVELETGRTVRRHWRPELDQLFPEAEQ